MFLSYEIRPAYDFEESPQDYNWFCACGEVKPAASNLDQDEMVTITYQLIRVDKSVTCLADDARFENLDENLEGPQQAFEITQGPLREMIDWVAQTGKRWSVMPIFATRVSERTPVIFTFTDLSAATEAKLKFAAFARD